MCFVGKRKNILKARVTIHYSLKKRSPDCLPRYAERIHIDPLKFCLIVGTNPSLRGTNVNPSNMSAQTQTLLKHNLDTIHNKFFGVLGQYK